MRIAEAEEILMPYGFLRVHKGYLVNLAYVQDLQAEKIVMQNGKDIPIGTLKSIARQAGVTFP